jgi:hypothetical protein
MIAPSGVTKLERARSPCGAASMQVNAKCTDAWALARRTRSSGKDVDGGMAGLRFQRASGHAWM